MQDQISRAITDDGALRVYAATTTQVVQQAQTYHNATPLAIAALGRMLTGGLLLAAMQKEEQVSVTLQVKGDGPLGTILAVAEGDCTVRGYVSNPDVELPLRPDGKLDVGHGVGKNGVLSVVRDFGRGQPYTGQVELVSGEIAEDLTYYYALSEQTPSAFALGVLVDTDYSIKAAGGYVIQLMPGTGAGDDQLIATMEEKLKTLPPVTELIARGVTAEGLLEQLLEGVPYSPLGTQSPRYLCKCGRERVERMLISVGAADLQELADDPAGTQVTCSFCDKHYEFSPQQLTELLGQCSR